jgi:hypothetical protein
MTALQQRAKIPESDDVAYMLNDVISEPRQEAVRPNAMSAAYSH